MMNTLIDSRITKWKSKYEVYIYKKYWHMKNINNFVVFLESSKLSSQTLLLICRNKY